LVRSKVRNMYNYKFKSMLRAFTFGLLGEYKAIDEGFERSSKGSVGRVEIIIFVRGSAYF